ncbi:eIF2 kinase IF2K-B [Toxoplasma gondii ARI]|uniref:eIF2 kinase IF2K-B n=1 Tax=Toxoplasma gondii ARI TaxID=1074872 RepID=A0A139Y8L6_TOXGO|nr:eIF2 kinase IF2K-B [Toxoplasma gondii ARI]
MSASSVSSEQETGQMFTNKLAKLLLRVCTVHDGDTHDETKMASNAGLPSNSEEDSCKTVDYAFTSRSAFPGSEGTTFVSSVCRSSSSGPSSLLQFPPSSPFNICHRVCDRKRESKQTRAVLFLPQPGISSCTLETAEDGERDDLLRDRDKWRMPDEGRVEEKDEGSVERQKHTAEERKTTLGRQEREVDIKERDSSIQESSLVIFEGSTGHPAPRSSTESVGRPTRSEHDACSAQTSFRSDLASRLRKQGVFHHTSAQLCRRQGASGDFRCRKRGEGAAKRKKMASRGNGDGGDSDSNPTLSSQRLCKDFTSIVVAGRGGCGRVLKATHVLDGQTYAIKEIKFAANREHLDAHMAVFLREVLCLRRLDAHPNIVRYFNSWVEVSPPPLTPENAIDHTSPLASQDQVPVGAKTTCVRSPLRPSMRGHLAGHKIKVFKDDTLRWNEAEGGDAGEGSDEKMSQTPQIRYSSCGLDPECEQVCDRNPDHGGRNQNRVQAFSGSQLITACNGALAEEDKEVTDKSKMPGPCPSRDRPPCVSFPTGRPKMSTRSTIQIGHNKHMTLPPTTLTVTGARLRSCSNCPRGANAPFENTQRACLRKEGLPCKVTEFFPVQHGCSDLCAESPEEVDRRVRRTTTKESGKKGEGKNADSHSAGAGWAAMRGETRNGTCRRNHVSESLNAELETISKDFLRLHNTVSRRLVVSNTHDGNDDVLPPSCNDQSYALGQETGASATDCERWSDGGTQEQEADSREAPRDKENWGYDVAKQWTEDVGKQETEEESVHRNGQGTSIAFQNVGHAFACINSNRNDEVKGLEIALEAREEREDAHRPWTRHTGDMQSPPDGETSPKAREKGGTYNAPSWYRDPGKSGGEALRDKDDKYSYTTGKHPPESSSTVWSDGHTVTGADWTSVRTESRPAVRESIRNMGKKDGTKILVCDDFWPCYEFYSDDNGEDGLQIVFAEVDPGGVVSCTRKDGVQENEENAAGLKCTVDVTSRSSGVPPVSENTLVVSTQHSPTGKSDIRSRETERRGSGMVEMGERLMNQMANEVILQEKVCPFLQPSSRMPWDISLFAVGGVAASDKGEGTPESYRNHHATMSMADMKERSYKPRTRRHSCGYPRYPKERLCARRGRSQSFTASSDRLPDEAVVESKEEAQHTPVQGTAAKAVDVRERRNLEETASAGLKQSAIGTHAVLTECHRSTIHDDGNGVSIRNQDVSLPSPRLSYHRKRHPSPQPLTGGVNSSETLRYKRLPQSERQGNGRQETTVVNLRRCREAIKGVQSKEMRGRVRAKANTSQNIPDLSLSRRHFLGLSYPCERNQCKVAVSLYIQMEYCGMSLDEYIAQTPEVDPERNEEIVAMIISGLYQCHSAGVMHRDLKPSNIFIDKETGVVKIGDFGLAFSEDMKQVPSSDRNRGLFEKDISSKNCSSIVTPNSATPDSKRVYGEQDEDCQGASSDVLYGGSRGVKEVLKGGEESAQMRISRANTAGHQNLGKEEQQHYHRRSTHNLHPLPITPFLSATPLAGGTRPHSSVQDGTLYKTQVLQSSPGETPCVSCPEYPKRGPHSEMSSAGRSSLLAERTTLISGVGEQERKSVDREKISLSPENFPGLCPSELPTGAVEHVEPSSLVMQKPRNDPTKLKKEALSSVSPVVGEVPSLANVQRSHAACLTPRTTWEGLPNCQSPVFSALRRDLEKRHHDTTRLSMAPSCMKHVSLPASISGTPRLASTPARTCSCGWQTGHFSCCASPVKTVCPSPLHLSLDISGCVHSPCNSPHRRSQIPVPRCRNHSGLHWPTSVVPLHSPCSCVAGSMHESNLWSPRMGFAASMEGGGCCGTAGGPCCSRRCRAPTTCRDPYCHLCDSFEEGDKVELRLDADRHSPKSGGEKSCVSSRTDGFSPETGLPNSARVSTPERGTGQGTTHLVPETSQSGRRRHEFRRSPEQRIGTIDECYNQVTVPQTNMVTSGIPEGTIERLPCLSEEMNDGNQGWAARGANAKDSSSCCPSVRCQNPVKGTENTTQSRGWRLSRSLSQASPAYLNEETRQKARCVSPEFLCGGRDRGGRGGATAVHESKTIADMCSIPCHENTARHRCPSLPCTPRDGPPTVPALFEKRTAGVGTRAYAPPEQLQGGRYDFSVDIWALGLIVLDLFTRCNTAMEQAMNFRNARDGRFPPSVTSTYPWVVPFCRWCLQNDPSKRPTIRQLYQHYCSTGSVFGPKTATSRCSASGLLSHTEDNNVVFPLCLPLPHIWTGTCLPHRLLPSDDFFHSPRSGVLVNVDSHARNDDSLGGTVGLGQTQWQNSVVALSPPACGSYEFCDQASSSCFDAHISGQSHPPQSYASSPLRIPCNHSCFPADLSPLSLSRSPRESAHTSTCVAGERSCGDTARSPTCVCGPSAHASPAISTRLGCCACPITGPCRGEAVDEPNFCVVRDSEGEDNTLLSGCSCMSISAGSSRRPESPWQGQHMNTPSTCPSTTFIGCSACQCPFCACCVCRGCSGAVCEVFPAEGLASSAASGGPVSPTALKLSSEGRMFKDTSSEVWGQPGVALARCRKFPTPWSFSPAVVHGDESKTSPPHNWSRPAQEPDSCHLWYMLPPPRTLLP